jgi:hypothetical protein
MTRDEEDPAAGAADARRSAGATMPRRVGETADVRRPAGRFALALGCVLRARDGFEPSFRDFDRAMIAPVLK